MGEKELSNYVTLADRIELLVQRYFLVAQNRNARLFTEFLMKGYQQTSLSTVSGDCFEDVVYAKVCLGSIITLYDDLADNPALVNPRLLNELYRLNINERPIVPHLSLKDKALYELACFLFDELRETLFHLPRYEEFLQILIFDIRHVFLANQYAELMTTMCSLRNHAESKLFGPYNMGMVAAGMIDLMASPAFDKGDLGKLREILILGQRVGRIGNLISTLQREKREGDLTNEMLLHPEGVKAANRDLLSELHEILSKITKVQCRPGGVDVSSYAEGLSGLYNLHRNLEGII